MVQLPSTHIQKDLPVDNREIATAKKIKKLKYLDTLKPVMSIDDDQEAGLLIGPNCVRGLEPKEVISSWG